MTIISGLEVGPSCHVMQLFILVPENQRPLIVFRGFSKFIETLISSSPCNICLVILRIKINSIGIL
jgi:hypothetical protein